MTYTIIGGDNKEYGPISSEDMRLWISEGRLNAQTRVKSEADTTWRTLGSFPEFADLLSPQNPPPIGALPSAAAAPGGAARANDPGWQADVETRPAELRLGECLAAGWSFMGANFGFLIGAVLLTWVANAFFSVVAMAIPILGAIVALCFFGVVWGGYYYACLRRMRGENVGPAEVFSGFRLAFGQLLLAGLISTLLTEIGVCFCVIPCIYLGIAWSLALPLVIDRQMFFWSAMELSRKVVTKVWFEMLALVIVTFLPLVIIQTINIFIYAGYFMDMYHAAGDNWQQMAQNMQSAQPEMRTMAFKFAAIVQAGMLVNLFYIGGVMMRAYENLFGPRK